MTPDWRQIEVENRGLSVRSASFLGEGWCSRAYLVNEELVFRFPKRAEGWPELRREAAFLAFAADRLPLAVPRYGLLMPDSRAAGNGYAVYPYLRGRALDVQAMTAEKRAAAAERIALFLRSLHDLQPDPQVAAMLPHEDARVVAEQLYAAAERAIVPRLPPSEAESLRRRFETYLSTPDNFSFRPVVLHADLSREHLLVDDDSVVAVIDFGDVNWGDPDYDFHYLFTDFNTFAFDVARRYGHPDFEQLRKKLAFYALGDQVDTILDGDGYALAGQQDAAWRRLKELLQQPAINTKKSW